MAKSISETLRAETDETEREQMAKLAAWESGEVVPPLPELVGAFMMTTEDVQNMESFFDSFDDDSKVYLKRVLDTAKTTVSRLKTLIDARAN